MFELTKEKRQKFNDWLNQHNKYCQLKDNDGAIGGRLTYCFTPTNLGIIITVKCGCGAECDLTNVEDW